MSRIPSRRLLMVGAVGVIMLLGSAPAPAGAGGTSGAGPSIPGRLAQTIGPDFRISGPGATADDWAPTVAWNETEQQYLVVWPDLRNPARGWDLYGRLLAADGKRIGSDFRISGPAALGDDSTPELVWNAAENEYFVVWMDPRNRATRGWDVYGRRLAPDGSPRGAEIVISGTGAVADDWWPEVVWNGTDSEYLVVWEDLRSKDGPRGRDIYGRVIGANGTPAGPELRVSGPAALEDETRPDAVWNGADNEFLVVWQDTRTYSTRKGDVYGRRLESDGKPASGDFRVSGPKATAQDWEPVAVWNETDNEYLVVWVDGRNGPADIYGRRLQADGKPASGDLRICSAKATKAATAPAVAWDGADNQYVVIWMDKRNEAAPDWNTDVYGRRLGADGKPIGGDFKVTGPGAAGNFPNPELAWNSIDDQFLAVWMDWRNDSASGSDIYGRRLAG